MKVFTLPLLALAASAFVIPSDETVESLTLQDQEQEHPFWKSVKNVANFWDELEERFNQATEGLKQDFLDVVEPVNDVFVSYGVDDQSAFAGEAWMNSADEEEDADDWDDWDNDDEDDDEDNGDDDDDEDDDDDDDDNDDDDDDDGPRWGRRPRRHHRWGRHGPHHRPHKPCHKPHKTVYQLIASSKYTTKLAAAISEFPDLVQLLNGTKANYTVFAPTNKAFARIPKGAPKPPKSFLKKLLLYHVSPEFYPAGRILTSRTIPTALKSPFLGNRSQRLSTQIGFFKLSINFYARVVGVDFFGTNGVVHGLDSFLLPPPKGAEIISILPTYFSTLGFALEKTGLYSLINNTKNHEGGTLFAPTNFAFAVLGPKINAFLFSPFGLKYLKALLAYHVVPDVTVYSDAIYKAGTKEEMFPGHLRHPDHHDPHESRIPRGQYHIELHTILFGKTIGVDVSRFGRLINMRLNGYTDVSVLDGIAADGVIHVLSKLLIPSKTPGAPAEVAEEMTLEEFKERLEPYIEADNDNIEWELK